MHQDASPFDYCSNFITGCLLIINNVLNLSQLG